MSLIQVEDLTFTYPGGYDTIFENVSFSVDTDWKLGFIGRNGRGKTTFLRLLEGKYEYSGTIRASVRFDYFPFPVEDPSRATADILAVICPEAVQWELERELSYLEVDGEVLTRPLSTLSGGERTKVLLAALFLREGNFLLIDEPTNHLDTRAREMVAAYLRRRKGFILVSHDRAFLDGCVDHILSLNRADIEVQSGNFSSWMENFRRQQVFEQTEHRRLTEDIRRLREAAGRTAAWSDRVETSKNGAADKGYVGHRSAKMMKRAKVIEARRQDAIEQKSALLKNTETAEALKLSPLTYHSDTLVSFVGAAPRYGEKTVCEPITLTVHRGDRIALEGRNGCGKSSLLKLLTGQEIDHTGTVTVGSGLVISCVPQDTAHLHGSLAEHARQTGIDESLFKAILRKMDFERVQFEKDMADYSGGQKKKVLIAASLCRRAHLYIWDEPLNFIDIYSRMQIEQLLAQFAPTMLFVEHDRAFQENIATDVITVEGK